MNIESLRMFCRVVDEGSISKAARLGFVSQPAVTRQIRQLENQYGLSLFDRNNGKLKLTKAGKVLYPYAREIIELDHISHEAMQEVLGNQETVLNVGASLTIGEYLLPGLLGRFSKLYPDIKFSLLIGNTPYMLSKLDANEIDIAMVESEVKSEEYKFQKIADDELVLVSSFRHSWSKKDVINIDDLAGEKMIWREKDSGTRLIVENALRKRGILHKITDEMELGSMQSIKSAVEADLGVSILPRITIQKELKYGTLREIPVKDFTLMRDLWIVQKLHRFKKRSQSNFEKFILK